MGGGLIAGKDGPLIHAGGIVGGGIGKLSPGCDPRSFPALILVAIVALVLRSALGSPPALVVRSVQERHGFRLELYGP